MSQLVNRRAHLLRTALTPYQHGRSYRRASPAVGVPAVEGAPVYIIWPPACLPCLPFPDFSFGPFQTSQGSKVLPQSMPQSLPQKQPVVLEPAKSMVPPPIPPRRASAAKHTLMEQQRLADAALANVPASPVKPAPSLVRLPTGTSLQDADWDLVYSQVLSPPSETAEDEKENTDETPALRPLRPRPQFSPEYPSVHGSKTQEASLINAPVSAIQLEGAVEALEAATDTAMDVDVAIGTPPLDGPDFSPVQALSPTTPPTTGNDSLTLAPLSTGGSAPPKPPRQTKRPAPACGLSAISEVGDAAYASVSPVKKRPRLVSSDLPAEQASVLTKPALLSAISNPNLKDNIDYYQALHSTAKEDMVRLREDDHGFVEACKAEVLTRNALYGLLQRVQASRQGSSAVTTDAADSDAQRQSIKLFNISLPLFWWSHVQTSRTTFNFFVLFKVGTHVQASSVAEINPIEAPTLAVFEEELNFLDLPSDVALEVSLFAMKNKREGSGFLDTPKKKAVELAQRLNRTGPAKLLRKRFGSHENMDHRTPVTPTKKKHGNHFVEIAHTTLRLSDLTETAHELRSDTDEVFPVGTHVNFSAAVTLIPKVENSQCHREGYLTVFEQPSKGSGIGQWRRKWVILDKHRLCLWTTHKDVKDRRPPASTLSLDDRGELTVRKIPRSECSRAHSFAVEGLSTVCPLTIKKERMMRSEREGGRGVIISFCSVSSSGFSFGVE